MPRTDEKKDDFSLIRGCTSGDKKSWDEFVERFSRLIYDTIIRTFHQYGSRPRPEVLEDLFQDFFRVLLENDGKVLRMFQGRNGCTLASYLRVVASGKAIDFLRTLKPVISLDQENEDGTPTSDLFLEKLSAFDTLENIEREEMTHLTETLLKRLNEDEAILCRMFFFDRKKPAQIAESLGISVENFYVKKQRVLDKLRRLAIAKKID